MRRTQHFAGRKTSVTLSRRIRIMIHSMNYMAVILLLCSVAFALMVFLFGPILLPIALFLKVLSSFAVFFLEKDLSRTGNTAMYYMNLGITKRWIWKADTAIFVFLLAVLITLRGFLPMDEILGL